MCLVAVAPTAPYTGLSSSALTLSPITLMKSDPRSMKPEPVSPSVAHPASRSLTLPCGRHSFRLPFLILAINGIVDRLGLCVLSSGLVFKKAQADTHSLLPTISSRQAAGQGGLACESGSRAPYDFHASV